jgi:hypothetical protein
MTSPSDRIIARLDHAWRQLQILNDELDTFYRSAPYRAWPERDQSSGDYLVWVEPTKVVPPRFGFVTGDFINNVRASLDNLASALPGATITQAAFPILKQPPKDPFAQNRGLKGIDPAAVAVIESLQPYQPTPSASSVKIPIGQVLLRLQSLWNCDKHRSPIYAHSTLQGTRFQVDSSLFTVVEKDFGPLTERRVMLRLRPVGPHGKLPELESELRAQIGIREEPGLAGTVPVDLTNIYQCVRNDVLPRLVPFL